MKNKSIRLDFLAGARRNLWTLLAVFVILGGIMVRLVDLTDPPFDYHPTRQLLNALIARAIYVPLDAEIDPAERASVAGMAMWLERDEPPVMNGLVAITYLLAGGEVLWIARLYSIFFWSIGGFAIYLLAKRFVQLPAVVVALAVYMFLPLSIYASRSFQVDPLMVMLICLSALACYDWAQIGGWKRAVTTGLLFGLTILVKVTAFFPLFGLAACLLSASMGLYKALRSAQTWAVLALAALPGVLYYFFLRGDTSSGYFLFWMGSFWRQILTPSFYIRWLSFFGSILGLSILFFGFWGMLIAPRLPRALLAGMWIGYGLYGLFFPFQITTHDYYHLMMIPILALSLAPLAEAVLVRLAGQQWPWRLLAGLAALVLIFYPSWVARSVLVANDYHSEPATWQGIGQAIPSDEPFIALTNDYGYPLMYYGHRYPSQYWPTRIDLDIMAARGDEVDVQAMFMERTQGMQYFLVTMPGELQDQAELAVILSTYPLLVQGDGFQVYDLAVPAE